jgi:hypothetical protein
MKNKNAAQVFESFQGIYSQLDRLYYSNESEKRERLETLTETIDNLVELFTQGEK